MKYQTAGAFRQALETRLKAQARGNQQSLVRLRKSVAFDRLMARLLAVAPDRWILKGGLALDYRLQENARTTLDVDFLRPDGEEAAHADLIAAQSVALDDFFAFEIERTDRLDDVLEGIATRYRATCTLASHRFEMIAIDIGHGDVLIGDTDLLTGSDLLAFAGIASVAIPVIPIAQIIAEKVHAYTRTYGATQSSSRVKDLVDLVLIQRNETVNAGAVRQAFQITFEHRGTHPLPDRLPPPPSNWRMPFAKLAGPLDVPNDIDLALTLVAAFLDPVLNGSLSDDVDWLAGSETWRTDTKW